MLWIVISLFFCWLIFREFQRRKVVEVGFDAPDPAPVYKPYVAILAILAALFAWPPVHFWFIERFLSAKATELAEGHRVKVHCNTVFDSFFDPNNGARGHANPATGEIVLQPPHCKTLMDYIAHPARASRDEIFALGLLTHESMHVRGERNESITECEAVQRNYRAAKILGVPDTIARKNALDYFHNFYLPRERLEGSAYFSPECRPGKAMDEHLADSAWATY